VKRDLRIGILSILFNLFVTISSSAVANYIFADAYFVDEPLHATVEAMGSFAALSLAVLILSLLKYRGYSLRRLWIACALISMGVLDGFHASVMPGSSFVWFRSMSSAIGGLFFSLTMLPDHFIKARTAILVPSATAVLTVIFCAVSIKFPDLLPATVHLSSFTRTAISINTLGGLLFLAAGLRFFKSYLFLRSPIELIFSNLCLLFGMAGLLFTVSELWAVDWWLWHVFRLTAYLITLPYTFLVFRKVEEELEQVVAKLRSSNAALENFAYIASHDLKEPLLSIASMLKLLERRTRDKLDAESQAFITDSMSMTTRLQALVSALLAYSRVGTQLKPFEPTDCNEALKRSLENLRTTIEQSGAVVTHDPLPEIIADPLQMVLVFQNLLSNAIKFRGDGVPRVHISVQRKEKEWVFAVHDKGIGIPAGQTEQIFEIFQRLHKDKYQGSGIGLATCKKIVERHGGRIWATSVQGEGTTFYFTIPDRSA